MISQPIGTTHGGRQFVFTRASIGVDEPKDDERKRMTSRLLRVGLGLGLVLVASGAWAESSVWVVRTPTSAVYLAGSCHVLRASDYPLPPEFEAAYRECGKIVFETPPADMKKPEVETKLMQMMIYEDGRTLKQHLTPQAYAKVEAFCKSRGYPLEQLQSFRPWMLSMTLLILEMQRLGLQPAEGVDEFFDQKARRDGKAVEGLETVDEQIGFLTLLDQGMDNEQVVHTISELEQLSVKLSTLVDAWKKGDEQAVAELVLQEFKDQPKLYRALIVDRNQKWLKKIEGYLNQPGREMVIVGVAHLAGRDGLLESLRKLGYKVAKVDGKQ
jgi:uncharacterized protein YbaP (TraB family)